MLASSSIGLAGENLCYIGNPADECALEEALRIKDARSDTEVIVLSVGPQRVGQSLQRCMAMGADRVIRIWDACLIDADAQLCAQILAKAIAGLEVDLVLCGSRSLDLAEGQVPGMLAEFLALPYIIGVTSMELSSDASVRLQRKLQRGDREIVECSLPALFALEPSINQPRYPTVQKVLWSRRCPISMLGLKDLGFSDQELDNASPTVVTGLNLPRPRPKRTPFLDMLTMDSGLQAEERLRLVLSGGMTETNGELWQGTPQDLANRLIEYLKGQGFL